MDQINGLAGLASLFGAGQMSAGLSIPNLSGGFGLDFSDDVSISGAKAITEAGNFRTNAALADPDILAEINDLEDEAEAEDAKADDAKVGADGKKTEGTDAASDAKGDKDAKKLTDEQKKYVENKHKQDATQGDIDDLTTEATDLEKQIEEAKASGDTDKANKLQKELDDVNEKLEAKKKELDKLVKEEDELELSPEEKLEALQNEMDQLDSELEAKKAEQARLQAEAAKLQEDIEAAKAEGDQEKVEELQGELDGVNSKLDTLDSEINSLQSRKDSLQNNIDAAQAEVDAKKAQEAAAAAANQAQSSGGSGDGGSGNNGAVNQAGESGGSGGNSGGSNGVNNGGNGGGGNGGSGSVGGSGGGGSVGGSGGSGSVGGSSKVGQVDTSKCSDEDLAKGIDEFLASKGSPCPEGTGALFVEAGKKYDVDPLVLVSIAGQETQWGQTGIGMNGMLGVGAYDSDPNNATRDPKFAGVANQIERGAETFANIRAGNGGSASDSIADQLKAVNNHENGNQYWWASDSNWDEGVQSIYENQVAPFILEHVNGAETVGGDVAGMLSDADSMIGLCRGNGDLQNYINENGSGLSTYDPWCAAFATAVENKHGNMDFSQLDNWNYCPSIKNWAEGQGTWHPNGSYNAQPGDMLLFDWDSDGCADHVGIVESYDPSTGVCITLEGNTSGDASGSQVARKERSSCIMGFISSNV